MSNVLLHCAERAPEVPWQFRCYRTGGGRNDLIAWDKKLSKKGRANRNVRMAYLKEQPPGRWVRPDAVMLKNHASVIHFKDENRQQHRLFGFFAPQHHAFVICFAGTEKDSTYDPADYEQRIEDRRQEIESRLLERTAPWPWPV